MGRLPKVEYEKLNNGRWNWILRAVNGEEITCGHEPGGFATKRSARRNYELTKTSFVLLHHAEEVERISALVEAPKQGVTGSEVV